MRGYVCIVFIDLMFSGKSQTDFINLFSPRNFKKNDKVILDFFFLLFLSVSDAHMCDTKLDNPIRLRLRRIKVIFCITVINKR